MSTYWVVCDKNVHAQYDDYEQALVFARGVALYGRSKGWEERPVCGNVRILKEVAMLSKSVDVTVYSAEVL